MAASGGVLARVYSEPRLEPLAHGLAITLPLAAASRRSG
jgi:hypothetical protein